MKKTVVTADGTFFSDTAPIQGSYEKVFKKAADTGFDAVQITVDRAEAVPVRELISLCEKYGLQISAMATGRIYSVFGYSLGMEDEKRRRVAVSMMNELSDVASKLGACGFTPYLIVGAVRGKFKDASSPEIFMKQFHKSMDEVVSYAASRGVTVIIEAIETQESEAYRDITETAEYIRAMKTPYLKLQIDTMHMRRESQSFNQVIAAGDVLVQTDLSGDERRCPADDDYDYQGLIRTLKEIDYQGWLTFEYRSDKRPDAAEAGYEFIDKLIKEKKS